MHAQPASRDRFRTTYPRTATGSKSPDDQATFRSDFRDHTLVYEVGDPSQQSVGLEVRTQAVLDRAVAVLAANGITATAANADALVRRKARAMASFRDRSGNTFELVVRPETSGWRYFPSRDAGITGLAAAALRSTSNGADEALWTTLFNGRVSDWVGDAAFIRFDDAHHRLALHPSNRGGVLAVEYAVEGLNQIMQAMYFLQSAQVKIVHGPRAPADLRSDLPDVCRTRKICCSAMWPRAPGLPRTVLIFLASSPASAYRSVPGGAKVPCLNSPRAPIKRRPPYDRVAGVHLMFGSAQEILKGQPVPLPMCSASRSPKLVKTQSISNPDSLSASKRCATLRATRMTRRSLSR